jgi:DNA-binding CsgD family transcriptional regulator
MVKSPSDDFLSGAAAPGWISSEQGLTAAITATRLTRREVDVLRLVAADWSDATIASHLGISVRTVETHVSSMLAKTGAKSRTGLVGIGYSTGLLLPGTLPPACSLTCWLAPGAGAAHDSATGR